MTADSPMISRGGPPSYEPGTEPSRRISGEILFENHRVRVWKLVLQPGEWFRHHRHEHDHLRFYPKPGTVAVLQGDPGDAPIATEQVLEGAVRWNDVGRNGDAVPRAVGNAGDEVLIEYTVELLQPSQREQERADVGNDTFLKALAEAGPSPLVTDDAPAEPQAGDEIPTQISPDLLVENELVRVWKSTMKPDTSFAWHRHLCDYLYIYTTPGHMEARVQGLEKPLSAPWDTDFVYYTEVGRKGQVPHTLRNVGGKLATHYTVEILGESRSEVEQLAEHNNRTLAGSNALDPEDLLSASR
ncbi:MAG TPA: hypothetical protein VNT55_00650 [Baekduia sp.]|nr:hypothetical protein [Baekduia sp.]